MLTIVLLSTTCLLILADQLTKVWAVEQLHNANRVISVIDGVFEFRYLENRGVAFGMMQGQTWLFIPITLVITIFLIGAVRTTICG